MSTYSACGFVIESDVPLPECLPLAGNVRPDVTLRIGSINHAWGEPTQHAHIRLMSDGSLHLGEDDGPRFLVSGSTVVVDPRDAAWRRFFLGPVLGAVCYFRGRLPLHASSVEIGAQAVVFAGPSGVGKSTLAAGLVSAHGHPLISDELSAVDVRGNGPVVFPYLPYHKLSAASAASLDIDLTGASMLSADDDKPIVRAREVRTEPTRCATVYFLVPSFDAATDSIERLPSAIAVPRLMDNLYRTDLGEFCRTSRQLLAATARLATHLDVRVLTYARRAGIVRSLAAVVLDDLSSNRGLDLTA